jgi:hypothetical protein
MDHVGIAESTSENPVGQDLGSATVLSLARRRAQNLTLIRVPNRIGLWIVGQGS